MTIEEILALEEGQTFDRKSIRIDAKTLAEPLCAFANADGGIIAIGITNSKRQIEGVDGDISKLNDLLRIGLSSCMTRELAILKIPLLQMQSLMTLTWCSFRNTLTRLVIVKRP